MSKIKIESIILEHKIDDCPDTSFLGEYTDDYDTGIIVRQYDMFYEDLTAEEIDEIKNCREHTGFKPYAGGEKVGTKEYRRYGMQDYKRMEQLNNGDFAFIGIIASADICLTKNGNSQYQKITSSGIWGVESYDKAGIEEYEKDQIENLKEQLEALNIDITNFDKIKIERKD